MKIKERKNIVSGLLISIIKLIIIAAIVMVGINFIVIKTTEGHIAAEVNSYDYRLSEAELSALSDLDAECIMVLGASVNADGTPSSMLKDRLDVGIMAYQEGLAPKLLLTGDGGQVMYNETQVMKEYAEENGVPADDIIVDHSGFSTYESIYRGADSYRVERIIVVTQKYHLYRSLYGCERMGQKALGIASNQKDYPKQNNRLVREFFASDKDFVKWMFKMPPTFSGDIKPIV